MKVECLECGKKLKMITNSHLRSHQMTIEQYQKKYPDALMYSEEMAEKIKSTRHRVDYGTCQIEGCNNPINFKNSKYCSTECKGKARRTNSPICKREGCGKEKSRLKKVYCGEECEMIDKYSKFLEFQQNRPKCLEETCNNLLTAITSKYCSYSCSNKNRVYNVNSVVMLHDNWKWEMRKKFDNTCQRCKIQLYGKQLHMHHIIPVRMFMHKKFSYYEENLVTLCEGCHKMVDSNLLVSAFKESYVAKRLPDPSLNPDFFNILLEKEQPGNDDLFTEENRYPPPMVLSIERERYVSEKFNELVEKYSHEVMDFPEIPGFGKNRKGQYLKNRRHS